MTAEISDVWLRVYGLYLSADKILCSFESSGKDSFLKFPGGGLQPGEGIRDCLNREFLEETGLFIENAELYYLTENFIKSAFHPRHQVVLVYYKILKTSGKLMPGIREERFGEIWQLQNIWKSLDELSVSDFRFETDKLIFEQLKSVK